MQNQAFSSPEMQSYFNSLPMIVQENMKQASIQFNSLDELKSCAENMLRAQQ